MECLKMTMNEYNLLDLLECKSITLEDLETIEENEATLEVQFNGMSGENVGYKWYSIFTTYGEYQVYIK